MIKFEKIADYTFQVYENGAGEQFQTYFNNFLEKEVYPIITKNEVLNLIYEQNNNKPFPIFSAFDNTSKTFKIKIDPELEEFPEELELIYDLFDV